MLDYKTGAWDDRLLKLCGLEKDMMPSMLDSGEYASKLSPEVCSELEIDPFRISTCASHDTASAVAGIPAKDKDFAFLGTGTWFMLGIETGQKIITHEVIENGFTNEGGVSGSNFFAKNTAAGFWIIQECRKKWNKMGNKEYSWDEIAKLARKSRKINSLINVEDPAFSAGNQDMPELIRDFCNKTGQELPETIGETSYIIFASLAFTVKKYLTEMKEFTGRSIDTLHIIGGGVYNTFLCQLISNTTGVPILAGPAESASMGNLIMQLKAGGDIKDLGQGRELISKSINIQEYHPQDRAYWEEGFAKFTGILKKNNK
jgi:sugar (pentulose or hexulose) kinase